jgi:hypothetical protein
VLWELRDQLSAPYTEFCICLIYRVCIECELYVVVVIAIAIVCPINNGNFAAPSAILLRWLVETSGCRGARGGVVRLPDL